MTKTTLSPEERADLKAKAEGCAADDWRVASMTPSRVDTTAGAISITWFDNSRENPFDHAEAAAFYLEASQPSVVLRLLTALEEAEGRHDERDLFDAETDAAFADLDARIEGLEAEVSTLTARAEKAEQQRDAARVIRLGIGEVVIDTGTHNEVPAVFIEPVPVAGVVGEPGRAGPLDSVVSGATIVECHGDPRGLIEALRALSPNKSEADQ